LGIGCDVSGVSYEESVEHVVSTVVEENLTPMRETPQYIEALFSVEVSQRSHLTGFSEDLLRGTEKAFGRFAVLRRVKEGNHHDDECKPAALHRSSQPRHKKDDPFL